MLPSWADDGVAQIRDKLEAFDSIDDLADELLARAGEDRAVRIEIVLAIAACLDAAYETEAALRWHETGASAVREWADAPPELAVRARCAYASALDGEDESALDRCIELVDDALRIAPAPPSAAESLCRTLVKISGRALSKGAHDTAERLARAAYARLADVPPADRVTMLLFASNVLSKPAPDEALTLCRSAASTIREHRIVDDVPSAAHALLGAGAPAEAESLVMEFLAGIPRGRTRAAAVSVLYGALRAQGRADEAERAREEGHALFVECAARDFAFPPGCDGDDTSPVLNRRNASTETMIAFLRGPPAEATVGERVRFLVMQEKMREASHGRVSTPDDLASERIFGPRVDYRCACGATSGFEHAGAVCASCRVELLPSVLRRFRAAHIELARPVLDPRYVDAACLLLDMDVADLRRVLAREASICVDPKATGIRRDLSQGDLFPPGTEVPDADVGTGIDAIRELLIFGPSGDHDGLREARARGQRVVRSQDLVDRVALIDALDAERARAEWLVLGCVPVIPPGEPPIGALADVDGRAVRAAYERLLRANTEGAEAGSSLDDAVRDLFLAFGGSCAEAPRPYRGPTHDALPTFDGRPVFRREGFASALFPIVHPTSGRVFLVSTGAALDSDDRAIDLVGAGRIELVSRRAYGRDVAVLELAHPMPGWPVAPGFADGDRGYLVATLRGKGHQRVHPATCHDVLPDGFGRCCVDVRSLDLESAFGCPVVDSAGRVLGLVAQVWSYIAYFVPMTRIVESLREGAT